MKTETEATKRPKTRRTPGRECFAEGRAFPSLAAAGRALGLHRSTIQKRILNGWPGYSYADEGQRPRASRGKAVLVDGVEYESQRAAARALGVSSGRIAARLGSSNFPAYVDLSGAIQKTTRRKSVGTRRAWVRGAEYPSVNAAAAAAGTGPATFASRAGSTSFPDLVVEGLEKTNTPKPAAKKFESRRPRRVKVDGTLYPSIRAVSLAFGIAEHWVGFRCKSKDWPTWRRV